MQIVDSPIPVSALVEMMPHYFDDMVKAVADIGRGIIAVDAELHSDLESALIDSGSVQDDLWGYNIYPELEGDGFIEYDSLINIRPWQGNRSRYVEDAQLREAIWNLTGKLVVR